MRDSASKTNVGVPEERHPRLYTHLPNMNTHPHPDIDTLPVFFFLKCVLQVINQVLFSPLSTRFWSFHPLAVRRKAPLLKINPVQVANEKAGWQVCMWR